jgi:hypothetical protein
MATKILALTIIIAFLSCNDSGQHTGIERTDGYETVLNTREDSLFHEVMLGHDKGMAKIGKLSGSQKLVQQAIDSLQKLNGKSKNQNSSLIRSLDSLKNELNQADSSMNDWMEKFNVDSARNKPSERIEYLESERDKIKRVNAYILHSLEKADSLFRKN